MAGPAFNFPKTGRAGSLSCRPVPGPRGAEKPSPMDAETVTIKPDMRVIHPEHGDITEDVAREMAQLRREDNERLVRDAARLQSRIAAGRPGDAVVHNGFALKAEIHPAIYSYWRMREGKGFWASELKSFLKKHPECRVKARSANPTILVPDMGAIPSRRGPTGRRGRWAL